MGPETTLTSTEWYGIPALQLESDSLCVVTVPSMGAKITSLQNRVAKHEWLITPHTRPFKPLVYGSAFGEQDMTGWDEMYPTIDICQYPVEGPWHGITLPDHGEVWALPWEVISAAEGRITLQVDGRALPYRLTRALSFADSNTLRIDYTATNTGSEPLAAFWTAHPQFVADDETRVVLPDDVTQVMSVHSGILGSPGDIHPWPITQTVSGEIKHLDRIMPADPATCRKVYMLPDHSIGWAALQQESAGHWLRLEWDPQQLPYMGIWTDEGRLIDGERTQRTVALEPTNGFYDLLSLAWGNGRVPVIAPGEAQSWSLRVRVGQN